MVVHFGVVTEKTETSVFAFVMCGMRRKKVNITTNIEDVTCKSCLKCLRNKSTSEIPIENPDS